MWRKDLPETPVSTRRISPLVSTRQEVNGRDGKRSVIGPGIIIKGEVSGTQDVLIQGRVEGQLSLSGSTVTVGKEGRIKADVLAQVVQVAGSVEGIVRGEKKVLLSETGRVRGELIAPEVVLKEGCNFKGTVDTGDRTQSPGETGPFQVHALRTHR